MPLTDHMFGLYDAVCPTYTFKMKSLKLSKTPVVPGNSLSQNPMIVSTVSGRISDSGTNGSIMNILLIRSDNRASFDVFPKRFLISSIDWFALFRTFFL